MEQDTNSIINKEINKIQSLNRKKKPMQRTEELEPRGEGNYLKAEFQAEVGVRCDKGRSQKML